MPEPAKLNRSSRKGRFSERLVDGIRKWSEKLSWLPAWGAGLGTVVSFVCSMIAGGQYGIHEFHFFNSTFWWALGGTFALVVSLMSSTVLRQRQEAEEAEKITEKVNSQETLNEAVVPLLRSIAKLAAMGPGRRKHKVSQTVAQVSQAKSMLFPDVAGVRMVVYKMQPTPDGKAEQLFPIDFYGRSKNEPQPFRSDEPDRGERVFAWLKKPNPQHRFVPEFRRDDPEWAGSGSGYQTYISIPIMSDEKALGMLTVDAPRAGDLDETDVPMLRVLSQALATVFVLCPD